MNVASLHQLKIKVKGTEIIQIMLTNPTTDTATLFFKVDKVSSLHCSLTSSRHYFSWLAP